MGDARHEWRTGWPALCAGLLGTAAAQIHFASIGVILKPMAQGTGWATSTITLGILICSIVSVPGTPIAGILAQRFGLKRIIVPGLPLFLLCFAGLGFLSHTRSQWVLGWTLLALAGIFTKPNLWMLWAAQRFDVTRGMAFAFIMSGAGVLAIFVPIVTLTIVEAWGWRATFPILALAMLAIALPPLLLGVKLSPPLPGEHGAKRASAPAGPPGLTIKDAIRLRAFWLLGAISFFIGAGLISLQVHMVPLLQSSGLEPRASAMVAGAFGGSALLGRFAGGLLLDRYPSGLVGVGSLLLPAIGCLLFLTMPVTVMTAFAMAALMGLGVGAEGDVLGYVTSRYFGVRSFGTVYGAISGLFALGAGVGPFAMSLLLDRSGSYAPVIPVILGMLLICVACFLSLGHYPKFAAVDPPVPSPA